MEKYNNENLIARDEMGYKHKIALEDCMSISERTYNNGAKVISYYDANGKEIYWEGFKYSCDEEHFLLEYRNSNNYNETYSYDEVGRLIRKIEGTVVHDNETDTDSVIPLREYEYDWFGMTTLKSVTLNGKLIENYVYMDDGRPKFVFLYNDKFHILKEYTYTITSDEETVECRITKTEL